jgi:hypothetical protein
MERESPGADHSWGRRVEILEPRRKGCVGSSQVVSEDWAEGSIDEYSMLSGVPSWK